MRSKTIGGTYRFTYPNYGTPESLPDYREHSGQKVKILRKLTADEADHPMYEIEASDGWKGHACPDELRRTVETAPTQRKTRSLRRVLRETLSYLPKCNCENLPSRCIRCLVNYYLK